MLPHRSTTLARASSSLNSWNSGLGPLFDGDLFFGNSGAFNPRTVSGNSILDSSPLSANNSSSSSSLTESPQEERLESHIQEVANEVNSTIQQLVTILLHRKDELLTRLNALKKIYRTLHKNPSLFTNPRSDLPCNLHINGSDPHDVSLPVPVITFNKPDASLPEALSSLGFIVAPAFAPFCTASGDGLECAVPGQNANFTIITRNCFNEDILVGRENVDIKITARYNLKSPQSMQPLTSEMDGTRSPPFSIFNPSSFNGDSKSCGAGFNNTDTNGLANFLSSKNSNNSNEVNGSNRTTSGSLLTTNVPFTILDNSNGSYVITYSPPSSRNSPFEVVIHVSVNGMSLNESPWHVPIMTEHRRPWRLTATFGGEGNAVGQLCRPWGVAIVRMPPQMMQFQANDHCNNSSGVDHGMHQYSIFSSSGFSSGDSTSSDKVSYDHNESATSSFISRRDHSKHYLIAVADRSNNRVQLLNFNASTSEVSVINVFGSGPGTRPGLFDRPAGICINTRLCHIIVADKDNHRVQVFDYSGRYLFKFGEKGNRVGQFCYPWDVDVCGLTDEILVSDTRNRRVQLFSPFGQYIAHYTHPLDSPRGVAFLNENEIIVTDFNKHRIVIFGKYSKEESHKTIGFSEGSGYGEFLRPQGVAVSDSSIFCADSRNNRVCIYNMFTRKYEYFEDEDSPCDRPSGLNVVDNVLVVVDFGNNRLQICQR